FTASDGRNSSAPQTATITVGARPPAPPPPPVPRISGLRQSHPRWREPGKAFKHAPPVGTTFSFVLNIAARVTLTFTQRLQGRTVSGKCVAPTAHNAKHRACTRTKPRGLRGFDAGNGINHWEFSGSIPHHGRLPLGSYTVTFTARAHNLHAKPTSLR